MDRRDPNNSVDMSRVSAAAEVDGDLTATGGQRVGGSLSVANAMSTCAGMQSR
jgi:hypothetical protein